MPSTKLFANLRNVAGIKEVSVTGTSVQMVVSRLVEQYPLLETYLLENGQIRQHIIITINGHPITDWDTPVSEQDQIAIFPPIAGG
jgi:sulfur-carrier protein